MRYTDAEHLTKLYSPGVRHLLGDVSQLEYIDFVIRPSLNRFGYVDILLRIEADGTNHGAAVENILLPMGMNDDGKVKKLEEAILQVIDIMRIRLKAHGLVPYEKKPEEDPLPEWMVKP